MPGHGGGQPGQGGGGVGGDDQRDRSRQRLGWRVLGDDRDDTLPGRLGSEVGAVDVQPRDGDEDGAGTGLAGILDDPVDRRAGVGRGRRETGGTQQLGQGHRARVPRRGRAHEPEARAADGFDESRGWPHRDRRAMTTRIAAKASTMAPQHSGSNQPLGLGGGGSSGSSSSNGSRATGRL